MEATAQDDMVSTAKERVSSLKMWITTEIGYKVGMSMSFKNGMYIKAEVTPSSGQASRLVDLLGPLPDRAIQEIPVQLNDDIIEILNSSD